MEARILLHKKISLHYFGMYLSISIHKTVKARSHGTIFPECDSIFFIKSQSYSVNSIIDINATHSVRCTKMQSHSEKIAPCEWALKKKPGIGNVKVVHCMVDASRPSSVFTNIASIFRLITNAIQMISIEGNWRSCLV